MTSQQTENRKKKKDYLYKALDHIVDLLSAKEIEKDRINMANFKNLLSLVEKMSNMAFCIKRASEISTINSENGPVMDLPRQENSEEDDFHEK